MPETTPSIYERINHRLADSLRSISIGCFTGASLHLAADMHRYDAGFREAMNFDNVAIPAGLGTLALFSALSLACRQHNQ